MVVPELRLRFKAADEPPAAASFTPVAAQDLAKYELDGEKLSAIKLPKLRLAAIRLRLPASTLEQESVMRMLFAAVIDSVAPLGAALVRKMASLMDIAMGPEVLIAPP